jgi:hypothetical protein
MNRLLSRLALLAVLLISMLGVYQGSDSLTGLVLADGDSCPTFIEHKASNGPSSVGNPGPQNEEFVVDSIFSAPEGMNSPANQTLIQLSLFPEGVFAILPDEGGEAIIRVDDGGVTLWNCGDTEIEVLFSGSSEATPVEPGGNAPIHPGEAVYVDSSDIYYLAEGIEGEDASPEADGSPVAGAQPLNKELLPDALPAAHHGAGSHVSAGVAQPYKLCSGGGC